MFFLFFLFFSLFVFPPLPNTQIQSFFPQRNKSKATLPSFYAAVCVHLFLYLSMVYFCFSSINAQACLLLHQASGRQLRSFLALTGKWLADSPRPWSSSLIWISPETQRSVFCFGFFFLLVVPATEIMAGSKQTNLSDSKQIFKHTSTSHK